MSTIVTEHESVAVGEPQSRLEIAVVSDERGFSELEPLWSALANHSNLSHPFLTYEWVRSWWDAFGAGKTLHIVIVSDGTEVVGLAPLMLTRRKFYGLSLRCLEFISNVHTPRFDFLIASRHAEVYRAIWHHLYAMRSQWDLLLLCQIPEGSLTLNQLSRMAEEAGLAAARWKSADSPYVAISGCWDSYLRELHSKYRSNLRRRLRRLEEMGPVAMEAVAGPAALDSALEEGIRLEGAVWKDHNGTSIHSDHSVEVFYRTLATRFAQKGWLDLHFLRLGEQRIAFQYAVRFRDRVFSLKPGYDPAYAQCSPSVLLCMMYLEEAFQSGAVEFDFLGVEEEWKLQWTQTLRSHYWLFIFSNSMVSLLVHSLKFRLLPALRQRKAHKHLGNVAVVMRTLFGVSNADSA